MKSTIASIDLRQ